MRNPQNSVVMTYESALEELENILRSLQEGQVDIDSLHAKVERAEALLVWCKQRLRSVEGQLNNLSESVQRNNQPPHV